MNKYEEVARKVHKAGYNCSYSIDYPKPRSIDGKCGALLTCTDILHKLNKDELIPVFEQKFIEEFKYVKCADLIRNGRICNDNIGISARILSELIDNDKNN